MGTIIVFTVLGILALGWIAPLLIGIGLVAKGSKAAGVVTICIAVAWGFVSLTLGSVGYVAYQELQAQQKYYSGDEPFTPAEGALTADVSVAHKGEVKLKFYNREQQKLYSYTPVDGRFKIAPGKHDLMSISIEEKGEENVTWTAEAQFLPEEKQYEFKVDSANTLNMGPPFKAEIQYDIGPMNTVNMEITIKDQQGNDFSIESMAGFETAQPGYRIVDASGNEIAAGKFEYG